MVERNLRRSATQWLRSQGAVVHVNTGAGPVGRPDIDVWPEDGMPWMLELKTVSSDGRRTRLSPAQVVYIDWLRSKGVRVEVCHSLAEVQAAFQGDGRGG